MSVIAVNTRLLLPGKLDGMGWFAYETLRRITQAHPEHKFVFLFDRRHSREFIFSDNVKPSVIPPQARHPLLWYIWFEYSVAYALKKCKADIFLSPEGLLCSRTAIPQIGVVHDLNFEHYPQHLPENVAAYYKKWFRKSVQIAARLATVSFFSKSDLIETYKTDEKIIDVVCNGSHELYKPVNDAFKTEIKNKYTGGKPYFIFVGSLHPRKNVVNMLLAFDKFKKENKSDIQFLIVGNKQWWNNDIKQAFENLDCKDEIIFAGRQPADELAKLTASAHAMIYVSLFEGFGIPIIEAMNCDVPVLSSNVTSMPEVAGDAAVLVNPDDDDEIAWGMKRIAFDYALRSSLIDMGRIQKQKFTWDKSAQLLWQTIETVLNERKIK